MRGIILAAGQAVQLDGYNKLLIKDPIDGTPIIEKYLTAFEGHDISVGLGYRSINVMHEYPQLHYIYNSEWAVSNSSYSLSLALNTEPCYVISGDFFIEPDLIHAMDQIDGNVIGTLNRENRTLSALNVATNSDGEVTDIYQGKLKNIHDAEAVGIYKITSKDLLNSWRKNCTNHSNLFIGQNLALGSNATLNTFDLAQFRLDEVNTPLDYIRISQAYKSDQRK
jgi:choline kinase